MSVADNIASDDRVMKGIWKETIEVLPQYSSEGTEENNKRNSVNTPICGPRFETGPPEYEAEFKTTKLRHLARYIMYQNQNRTKRR
jgi:hypothetical protein